MLLTSGQISMGISSFIVFIFTSLLFLSGYVLQQQTVRSIQAVIRPPTPSKSANAASPLLSLPSLRSDDAPPPKVRWDRLAYVQLITSPEGICEVLLLFAELHRQGSRADRLMLYPRAWDKGHGGGAAARRMLDLSMERYGVKAWPVDPFLRDSDPLDPASYPLTALLALTHYNAVLTLATPALLLHSEPLDRLLAEAPDSPVSFILTGNEVSSNLLMMRPSLAAYSRAAAELSSLPSTSEPVLLRSLWPGPESLLGSESLGEEQILGTSALGRTGQDDLEVLQNAAVVVFNDDNIPGPAIDVPLRILQQSQPDGDAAMIWDGLRGRYRDEWEGICGLELVKWKGKGQDNTEEL
ncbi:MAG: hypothetical protein M1814_000197 [Vezdaea aestivalis]|nr:MAG: hypothetical protein M1814_000197 [Vezdaea aestivalis]